MKLTEFKKLIREEVRKALSEAPSRPGVVGSSIPKNIEDFAKRKGVLPLVKQVAKWANKANKKISGGTAIGKNYSTLILDLTYQGGEIRINTDTDEIEVNGEVVTDYDSFKKAVS